MMSIRLTTKPGERGRGITGGISNIHNKKPGVKALRAASEKRRLQNRTNRGAWSNASRGDVLPKETPFPRPVEVNA